MKSVRIVVENIILGRVPKGYAERLGQLNRIIIEDLVKVRLKQKFEKGEDWYFVGKERGDYKDACEIIANFLYFTQDPI